MRRIPVHRGNGKLGTYAQAEPRGHLDDVRPISDRHQLVFSQMIGPLQALIAQVQQTGLAVQNTLVELLSREEGLKLSDGWVMNVDTKQWQRIPPAVPPVTRPEA